MDETITRQYHGTPDQIRNEFARGLANAQAQGYEVVSQTTIQGKRGGCAGCLGVALLGIPFLFIRPKDTLIVTYRKRVAPPNNPV